MKTKFYLVIGPTEYYKCFIVNNSKDVSKKYILGENKQEIEEISSSKQIFANRLQFYFFLKELECSPMYHKQVYNTVKHSNLIIQLVPIETQYIDYKW